VAMATLGIVPIELPGSDRLQIVDMVRNPWGWVPLTVGGKFLPGHTGEYMERLLAQQEAPDPVSRRHHYVPKSYLQQWSFDGKRVWACDTASGSVRPLGMSDVCVEEDFYRVVGPDDTAHNRVELLFGVVDVELRRVQRLYTSLEDPESLELDDLLGLGCVDGTSAYAY
jgi:hypothetical protein